ncbi:MAG: outer membrane lipoprotein carrier protein LolA, partial [Vicinamibacterales bacterium]
TQTLTSRAADRPSEIETTNFIQYPDRFRIETKVAGGVNIQVFDGAHVWAKDPRGVHELPETIAHDAQTTMRRDPIGLLLAAKGGTVWARPLPDVKNAFGRMNHALELSAPDLNPIVLLIEPDTGLVSQQTFVMDMPGHALIEEIFSDYRTVDGVQVAFRGSRRAGTQTVDRRVTDIKINSPIDAALFTRPAS